MQQLDVQADEETLELEVEVERLLHEQEAEAGKQKVHGERPFQPSAESVTLGSTQNREHQAPTSCPKVDEQCENPKSTRLLPPDHPNQEVKTIAQDSGSAALTS